MTPGAGAIFDLRGMVGRIYKEDHYTFSYIHNMKALGLVVSEKMLLYVSPITPPRWGLYGPQGHGWQDL